MSYLDEAGLKYFYTILDTPVIKKFSRNSTSISSSSKNKTITVNLQTIDKTKRFHLLSWKASDGYDDFTYDLFFELYGIISNYYMINIINGIYGFSTFNDWYQYFGVSSGTATPTIYQSQSN